MARSTLDPDNAGQRRRRKAPKDDARTFGPSESSDSASDVVGAPTDPQARPGAEHGFDRVVGADEAGLGGGLDQAEEARQIAENAYYRSEKRGFAPGQEERDWLEAEAEIRSRRKKRR